jgi:hypothetical protein
MLTVAASRRSGVTRPGFVQPDVGRRGYGPSRADSAPSDVQVPPHSRPPVLLRREPRWTAKCCMLHVARCALLVACRTLCSSGMCTQCWDLADEDVYALPVREPCCALAGWSGALGGAEC